VVETSTSLGSIAAYVIQCKSRDSNPNEYYAAGPSRVTGEDGIHRCVHCEMNGVDETYTYCPNCGVIACDSHTKTGWL